VLARWKEYFQNLLSVSVIPERQQQLSERTDNHNEIAPPTYNEVCMIINKLKTNKAAGTGNITRELIKHGRRTLKQKIHKLICSIWNSEILPAQWNEGIICPIYEKGDRLNCNNCRPVMLLNIVYEI
jgi:hypothetical protein